MKLTIEDLESVLGVRETKYVEPSFECPFCRIRGKGVAGTIHINLDKGAALCHHCSYKSRDLYALLSQTTGKIPRRLMQARLSEGVLLSVRDILTPAIAASPKKRKKLKLPRGYIPLTLPPSGMIAEKCWEYLKGRGLQEEDIAGSQIGYAIEGRFDGMIIFPIYMGAKLVFYTSRQVLPYGGPKAIHPKGVPGARAGVLFNYNNAARARCVFVCEGPFDAYAWPESYGTGVGVLGHTLHEAQARMLAALSRSEEFVICFDADSHEATLEAAETMLRFTDREVSYILLEEGDPNSERKRLKRYAKKRVELSLKNRVLQKFLT